MSREVDLDITGMTCASCSARIEKKLTRLDGVSAEVNLPLNSAHVIVESELSDADLTAAVEKAGYGATVKTTSASGPEIVDYDPRHLRPRFIGSLILAVPIVAISMVMSWHFPGWEWIVAILALPVVTWGAWPFHSAAFKAARGRSTTMDTLVSVGSSSPAPIPHHLGPGRRRRLRLAIPATYHVWFEAAAAITVFLLIGKLTEDRAKSRATAALKALLGLGARSANVLREGTGDTRAEVQVPIDELVVGDVFIVRPGGDRRRRRGDRGASPRSTRPCSPANLCPWRSTSATPSPAPPSTPPACSRSEPPASESDTTLAAMADLVSRAQTGKPAVQRLADRISAVFVPIVFAISALTLLAWGLITGDWAMGLHAALTVLIIACPCALGLATPTALAVSSGRGSQLGILVSGPEALESTRSIDTVVLDKTGTLTTGVMTLLDTQLSDTDFAVLARLESQSEHPVARAIVEAADTRAESQPAKQANAGLGRTAASAGDLREHPRRRTAGHDRRCRGARWSARSAPRARNRRDIHLRFCAHRCHDRRSGHRLAVPRPDLRLR